MNARRIFLILCVLYAFPLTLLGQDREIKLPGIADDYMIAGAGKYWAFWIKSTKSVALLDIETLEFVRHIKIPSDEAIITCGRTKLIAAIPKDRILIKYDLETGERELTKHYPFIGVLKTCAMGSASNGPLYVVQAIGTANSDPGEFLLVDIKSFTVVPATWNDRDRSPSIGYREQIHLRVNASGDHFCSFKTRAVPMGINSYVRNGTSIVHKYLHRTLGVPVPGNYKKHVFTSGGVVLTAGLAKVRGEGQATGEAYIPSYDGPYYLGLVKQSDHQNEEDSGYTTSLFKLGDDAATHTFHIPGTHPENELSREADFSKRVHFSVQRRFLGMVANTRDSIYVKDLDK